MKKCILVLSLGFLLFSCNKNPEKKQAIPVARVFDSYLYEDDLNGIIPAGMASSDSLLLVKDFIDKWVRKELLLLKAEENLNASEKNVEKQIDDYRTSLLIFKYEQNFIQQKLDTNISQSEIEEYYNQNSSNFILNQNLVKATFIKVPKTAPDISKIRRWYKSVNESDIKQVEIYCYKYAEKYDYFNEDWVEFRYLLDQMPKIYNSPENILKYQSAIELSDTNSYYFVCIYDYRLEGSVAPIDHVSGDIKSIMLNKRKIQRINELEIEIYNDALNRGNFTIY
jgi:hypothetical protein